MKRAAFLLLTLALVLPLALFVGEPPATALTCPEQCQAEASACYRACQGQGLACRQQCDQDYSTCLALCP